MLDKFKLHIFLLVQAARYQAIAHQLTYAKIFKFPVWFKPLTLNVQLTIERCIAFERMNF
jgi:hypothetical protein